MSRPVLRAYAWPAAEGGLSIAWVAPAKVARDPRWIMNMYGRHGGGFSPFGSLGDVRIRADYEEACEKFSAMFGVACELRWGEAPPRGRAGGLGEVWAKGRVWGLHRRVRCPVGKPGKNR
jgi:hypothetical protein